MRSSSIFSSCPLMDMSICMDASFPNLSTKPPSRFSSTWGLSLMFLRPVRRWSCFAMLSYCSESSLTAETTVAVSVSVFSQ